MLSFSPHSYGGRPPSASVATGNKVQHMHEQAAVHASGFEN